MHNSDLSRRAFIKLTAGAGAVLAMLSLRDDPTSGRGVCSCVCLALIVH